MYLARQFSTVSAAHCTSLVFLPKCQRRRRNHVHDYLTHHRIKEMNKRTNTEDAGTNRLAHFNSTHAIIIGSVKTSYPQHIMLSSPFHLNHDNMPIVRHTFLSKRLDPTPPHRLWTSGQMRRGVVHATYRRATTRLFIHVWGRLRTHLHIQRSTCMCQIPHLDQ